MEHRRRNLWAAAIACGAIAFVITIASPLRQTSGDTVAGRVGAATLRCAGDLDLARIDWVSRWLPTKGTYYWMQRDATGQLTSIFGPAPAVVGSLALLDFGDDGDSISDRTLRIRERIVSAVLLALSTLLLVLAVAAHRRLPVAIAAGLVAAASFAGAATLGQGLWQATVALPWLVGALAALAWRSRYPRLAWFAPGLLLQAAMIRPTIAPLAFGLGLAWAAATGLRDRKTWAIAAGISLAVASPLLVWNIVHLETPFSLGQWHGNERMSGRVLVPELMHVSPALAGLLVSPGRGILWYAPIAIVGVVWALSPRASDRDGALPRRVVQLTVLAVGLQLALVACFFRWYGGVAYGPRLLAETVWVTLWLAAACQGERGRVAKLVAGVAVAVTIVVGQLGLWRFQPEQWETRRMILEIDLNAFWDVVDSPITATLRDASDQPAAFDSDHNAGLVCRDGSLESIPIRPPAGPQR